MTVSAITERLEALGITVRSLAGELVVEGSRELAEAESAWVLEHWSALSALARGTDQAPAVASRLQAAAPPSEPSAAPLRASEVVDWSGALSFRGKPPHRERGRFWFELEDRSGWVDEFGQRWPGDAVERPAGVPPVLWTTQKAAERNSAATRACSRVRGGEAPAPPSKTGRGPTGTAERVV
jgi:hypothetical protein